MRLCSVAIGTGAGQLAVRFDRRPPPSALEAALRACCEARRTCEVCGVPGWRRRLPDRPDPAAGHRMVRGAAVLCPLHARRLARGAARQELFDEATALRQCAPDPVRRLLRGEVLGPIPTRAALAQCADATTPDPERGWLWLETLARVLMTATRDQLALCSPDDLVPFLADPDAEVRTAALCAIGVARRGGHSRTGRRYSW